MEQSIASWERFLGENEKVEFVWLQFLSYTSNALVRIVPRTKFGDMLNEGQFLTMTKSILHLLPGDRLAEGASPSGKLHLRPDFSTAYCQAGSNGSRAVVAVDCVDENGVPIAECARSKLRELHQILKREMGCGLLVGFEVEVMFLRPRQEGGVTTDYEPVNLQHAFTSMTPEDRTYLGLIEAVARALSTVGIALEQFHAEAGPGQWEFVLPPAEPLRAIDILLRARETIMNVAQTFGLRATVSTQPIPEQACNGAHVHLSVNALTKDNSLGSEDLVQKAESFFAGIVRHLPAILAFSLPSDISYGRIATGIWSGGEYAAWGWENKEVALRRIQNNRFEIKLVDGLANPYLVLCALLSAGISGMREKLPLTGGNCAKAAARLSAEEREALGVKDLLPTTLDASMAALEGDRQMQDVMGPVIVSSYLSLKRGEAGFLRAMDDDQRRIWLIARY
ncbi:FluG family protein [Penicillium samsonianum]|uniref:FluG family protein n=1 Tax=Penicillium samsonianum TaxID=1882272 RepID=UPI002547B02B|nr:FluG family protein [Penicillium samsonianum]KAJ6127890.1 FluG family protein [Penicillium samsonianum]